MAEKKEMIWEELIKEKKRVLEAEKDKIVGEVVEGKKVKELIRRKPRARKSFREYTGKEIIIKKIEFDEDKAIVTFEVDGQEDTVETADKFLIERWLIDYKVALDLGAKGVKVKVKSRGKYGIAFE